MSQTIHERLNQIPERILSTEFLTGQGLGNEIGFWIFDYAPEDELKVREYLHFLDGMLEKKHSQLKVVNINLLQAVVDYLAERNFIDKAIQMQKAKGDEALLKALKGPLHMDKFAPYLVSKYATNAQDIVLMTGVEAANLRASVGTTGDSYDNALAETVNGLYKTEVIEYLKADWQGLADVQLATLNWVDWFNKKRVHSALGYVSPFEFEAMYYDKINPLGQEA